LIYALLTDAYRYALLADTFDADVDTSIGICSVCHRHELCYTGAVSPESDRFSAVLAVQGGHWQSGICHTTVANVPGEL